MDGYAIGVKEVIAQSFIGENRFKSSVPWMCSASTIHVLLEQVTILAPSMLPSKQSENFSASFGTFLVWHSFGLGLKDPCKI